jgi:hypothetical protein
LLAFVDESGTPHKNDDSPYYTLVAVCFHEWDISSFDKKIYAAQGIFRKHYNDESRIVEIKGTKFINKRIFSENMDINKRFIEEIFTAIQDATIWISRIVGEKPASDVKYNPSKLDRHHTLLINTLEDFARRRDNKIKHISIVFDNIDDGDARKVTARLAGLVHKAEYKGEPYNHITTWPFFVSSQIVPGIQIADVVASVIRHMYCIQFDKRQYSEPFKSWVIEKYSIIKQKFFDRPQDFPLITQAELEKISKASRTAT